MNDDDFAKSLEVAASRADKIVRAAIVFASEVEIPDGMCSVNCKALVAKHVDAQLHLLEGGNHDERLRIRAAFEKVAHAHATNGVRVKAAQPWHRDGKERERD